MDFTFPSCYFLKKELFLKVYNLKKERLRVLLLSQDPKNSEFGAITSGIILKQKCISIGMTYHGVN